MHSLQTACHDWEPRALRRRLRRRHPGSDVCRFGRPRQVLATRITAGHQPRVADFAKLGARSTNYPRRKSLAQLLLCVSRKEINRMFDNIFGIHEQALLLHGQRIGVLATNLANADTPNYKARDIDFSEVLAHTDGASIPLRATEAGHIALDDAEWGPGELKYRNPYQASLDGNTVEMPVEQAAFSENNVRYQASLTFINQKIAEMQLAIVGQ
jgi:flagellar basal-body rod protein FlgB